jgi:hypothetical protein
MRPGNEKPLAARNFSSQPHLSHMRDIQRRIGPRFYGEAVLLRFLRPERQPWPNLRSLSASLLNRDRLHTAPPWHLRRRRRPTSCGTFPRPVDPWSMRRYHGTLLRPCHRTLCSWRRRSRARRLGFTYVRL